MKSWRCKVGDVLDEAFRRGRLPVRANDIPKINEVLEEACSLIESGWTQVTTSGARATNTLAPFRNIEEAEAAGIDIDAALDADTVSWDDPRAVCWCIMGAVWLAAKEKGLSKELEDVLCCRICASIIETDYIYTRPHVDTLNKFVIMDLFILEWNDMDDRTKEEVLAILKAAQVQGDTDGR